MGGLLSTLLTIVVGLGAFALVLLVAYGLATLLPGRWRERGFVAVFTGPALIFLIIGLLAPAIRTIYMSLMSDSAVDRKFVGLKHYGEILSGRETRLTVLNNLTWVVVGTLLTTLFALIVARFSDGMKGERTAKSMIFIPTAVSLAGAGITWKFVYADNARQGLLNAVTNAVPGLPKSFGGTGRANWVLNRNFGPLDPPSGYPGFNTFLLIVIFIWASAGIATVFFSAAIKGVPESLIEAAKVDGATDRQAFYKVTLPYIRPTIITVMTITTIAALKAFDIVQAVTGGRFGTSLLATSFLDTIFLQQREGLGSAIACVIFILVIPFVVISRRAQVRAQEMMA
jgi:alpha-glucoside transport system permease protein